MLNDDSLKNTFDARDGQITTDGERLCQAILAQWMDALNQHDASAMEAVMRFPHVRMAANSVSVYEAPGNNPMDMFQKLADLQGWHHSAWTDIKLVQSSPIKAHYAVQYTRYRQDNSVIGIFDSLYIFTSIDGEWKLQLRSSFGP